MKYIVETPKSVEQAVAALRAAVQQQYLHRKPHLEVVLDPGCQRAAGSEVQLPVPANLPERCYDGYFRVRRKP